ncbi:hypothetical protein [Subtercola vilae]|uniref:Uncharacterized protein n=1 Tax=Subtercola vilae TaxID=2056433 RepID=A0A4T2BQD6_9MICO|nr:hypothetical protein [Subtercola vilae]TIH33667.1 hypothetical protein D4765_14385 [Subtercola vilae]
MTDLANYFGSFSTKLSVLSQAVAPNDKLFSAVLSVASGAYGQVQKSATSAAGGDMTVSVASDISASTVAIKDVVATCNQ